MLNEALNAGLIERKIMEAKFSTLEAKNIAIIECLTAGKSSQDITTCLDKALAELARLKIYLEV